MDENLECEVPERGEDHYVGCIWSEDVWRVPGKVSSLDSDCQIFRPQWFLPSEVVQTKTLLYQEIAQLD